MDSKNGWKYKKAYYNADIILQFPINSCKNVTLKSFIEKLYYFIEKICYLVARFCVGTSVIFITFFCCSRRCCRSCCRRFFIVEVKMIEIIFIVVLDLTMIFAGIIWFFENWLISSPEKWVFQSVTWQRSWFTFLTESRTSKAYEFHTLNLCRI